jgi:hypothetical protein
MVLKNRSPTQHLSGRFKRQLGVSGMMPFSNRPEDPIQHYTLGFSRPQKRESIQKKNIIRFFFLRSARIPHRNGPILHGSDAFLGSVGMNSEMFTQKNPHAAFKRAF